MSVFRPLLLVLSAMPCFAATFGTVVPHAQPLADLVIDEARRRLYVVHTYSNSVEVYATNVSPPRQTNVIHTKATPPAAENHNKTQAPPPPGRHGPQRPLPLCSLLRRSLPRHHRPQFRQLFLRL